MLFKIYNRLLNQFGKQGWWPVRGSYHNKIKDNKDRFEIIIGAILTQNTSWNNAGKALANLRKDNLIDAKKINKININKLKQLIRPAGYYNQKAERLKVIAHYLIKNYNSNILRLFSKDIKELRHELLNIKGIGPETADSIMLYAAEKPVFVIDAYTKRIFSRIGFLDENKKYEEFQSLFHRNLKKDAKLFKEYHALLVELAKQNCRKKPVCNNCPINKMCKNNSHHPHPPTTLPWLGRMKIK